MEPSEQDLIMDVKEYDSAVDFVLEHPGAKEMFFKAFPKKKVLSSVSNAVYELLDYGYEDRHIIDQCLKYSKEPQEISFINGDYSEGVFLVFNLNKEILFANLAKLFNKKYFSKEYFDEIIARKI